MNTPQLPILDGAAVMLRPITDADTDLIVKWRNTPSVVQNFIFRQTFTPEMHRSWLATKVATGQVVQYIIVDKADGKPVGSVYYRDIDPHNRSAEYGIFIGEESARGKGLGTETARLFTDFGFAGLHLHRISLRVLAENTAARRFVVDEMLRYEHCYPYVIGLVLRSTKHICNVPVHHRAREEGRSGYTLSKLLNLWMNGFTSFSVKPLRIATYFGTLFAAAGFLYLIYIIISHFTSAGAPIGWASTTALLLLLGGMILVVLGIMGEYVGRIYMCANAAPQYVEREVIRHEGDNA